MPAGTTRPRYGVACYAAFVSVSAYFGAVGLISELLPIDAAMSTNLPFHSPVFAGLALAVVVGLPTSTLAWLAVRAHPGTETAATMAGVLLVGWIAVEILIVREFSGLQVLYAAAGIGLIAEGGRSGWRSLSNASATLPVVHRARHRRARQQRATATARQKGAARGPDGALPG
jgi:hypothetical protein